MRWTEADVKRLLGKTARPHARRAPPVEPAGFPCTEPVYLRLPYPPLNNVYYRHVGHRVLLSAAGRTYRKLVSDLVRLDWPAHVRRPLDTPLVATFTLHVPSLRHRPDTDSALKGPMDAMQEAGVYCNDRQIVTIHITRADPWPPDGCLEVLLEPYSLKGKDDAHAV